ncbi:hypothetical protein [Sphingobium sp.]|uniref:hypothetical protein n=1 Tax=Sphingobium sp. TaxID=1912891 RepID=UPI0028BEE9B5|nr:hypothetical protein [Sphingobium sp.]
MEIHAMLNQFQRICAQTYDGGDFAHVEDLDEAGACGDTLFAFLMIELSSSEDCDSRDEAVRRLEVAVDNVEAVIAVLKSSESH